MNAAVEFQAVISDVQEEVQELITEVENLERFTTDTISFEVRVVTFTGLLKVYRVPWVLALSRSGEDTATSAACIVSRRSA